METSTLLDPNVLVLMSRVSAGAIPLHTRRGTPRHVIRLRRPLVRTGDVEVGDDLENPPALGPDHLVDDVRTVGGGVQSPSAERGALWRH